MSRTRARTCAPLLAASILITLAAAPSHAGAARLSGRVVSGSENVGRSKVALYAAGRSSSRKLATARARGNGDFKLSYKRPRHEKRVLYALASGGDVDAGGSLRLMAVLGEARKAARKLRINELTTVASAYSLNRFFHGTRVNGPSLGLRHAAATIPSLVTRKKGTTSSTLREPPNGLETDTLATFNTLANVLASCADGTKAACRTLFSFATAPGANAPTDTLRATISIARHPASNAEDLYSVRTSGPYGPALGAAPKSWVLSLVHTAGGFDGPGRMAFDSRGNIWVTNNFEPPGIDSGLGVISLGPTGNPRNDSPVTGGGIQGVWWGIAIDDSDRVWLSNYVGADTGDPTDPDFQGGNATAQFTKNGKALSLPTGFQTGDLHAPQGIAVDQRGNVWIANHSSDTVTRYANGDPNKPEVISGGGLSKPFSIAIDKDGNAWVTDNAIDFTEAGAVTKISPDGHATGPIMGADLLSPQGDAVDSQGNVWVASFASDGIVELNPQGEITPRSPIRVPSLGGPWGIAVDGNDNIWVGGFIGEKVTELCGADTSHCPPGAQTGDPISPPIEGFSNGGLQHITAVQVDESGNVWAANNWSSISPVIGGNGLVEFIGAAPPVKTPLIGPPQAP